MSRENAAHLMNRFGEFITASPTSFHAAHVVAARLQEADYTHQLETEPFDASPGGHYMIRDGAIMAWHVPAGANATTGFRIVGSHTDSPSFKLKPNPSHNSVGWQQVGMEVYGGVLLASWLNRDIGLAGRLVTLDGREVLVDTGAIAVIPQLAPHLDRDLNSHLELKRQSHMMPVVGYDDEGFSILDHLCELGGIKRSELGHYDIHATTCEKPALFGIKQQFFGAWRMDNLSSVFASLEALLGGDKGDDIAVLAAFDHEEVGSSTRSGASGPILEDVLRRIAAAVSDEPEGFHRMLARSSCISADAGHAVHPNYVEKHDPDNHPMFNRGPVLKINGTQRYASDAVSSTLWYRACEAAKIPHQAFVGNNDVPCGSTIGPLTATRLGISTVDVGIPLLSMHSSRELCGSEDVGLMAEALKAYWAGA